MEYTDDAEMPSFVKESQSSILNLELAAKSALPLNSKQRKLWGKQLTISVVRGIYMLKD